MHGRSLRTRIRRLHDEELGAQAAEYAMLGGVSAAACATLVALIRDRSTLTRVAEALFDGLARVVGSWF